MVAKLVSFDTTSRDSNLALIEYVANYLDDLGIASDLTYDDDKRKANLFATIGNKDIGGVVLSGHTDVVPVDGQDWTSDPFKVVERDGHLFGRGVSDMKSFVAIALTLTPDFIERAKAGKLATPIHLAFSYDEEIGCIGVRRLIADLARREIKPRACIVGEPTLMKPISGHKGKLSTRCHVHGFECHSSLSHMGVNAVEAAAEVVAYLKGMARRFRDNGPFDPELSPPHTTVHTGKINGGTALNIVPKDCTFDFEFRHLPSENPRDLIAEVKQFAESRLLPEMRAVFAGSGFDWQEMSSSAGLNTGLDEEVAQLVMQLTGSNSAGKVSFGTEGGLFQTAGIPTMVCGPGSIEQAHKPDEFIALDQIVQCEAFMGRLMDRLAA